MSLIESLLTGEWRLRRQQVREQREFLAKTRSRRELLMTGSRMNAELAERMQLYAGAEPGINRPSPNVLSTPEDYKQAYERIVLIRAARQLEEDGGFFDGLLDDFETYVVGDSATFMPNTGNEDADTLIREFLDWKFDTIDASNRLDLTKLAQTFVRSMKRDGECGAIPLDQGDTIQVRYYSGDCIGNPMIAASIGPNNFNGIRTDPVTDAPIFYDLYKRVQKMNFYAPDRTVRADEFWHYYDPFRLQQYHGVSVFKNAIRDGFDIDQLLEFTKLNMKFRATQLPSVHTETGRPRGAQNGYFGWGAPGAGANQVTTPSGAPLPQQVNVDGVVTNYLKLDEMVMEYPNDFPNQQLQVSIEEFRRQCCKGAKIPYEFAYRADNGGVVQRFWVNKAMNTFAKDKHLLKRILLNPLKNRIIQKGIDTGELDLDKFGTLSQSIARYKGQWQLGKEISVDYMRENEVDIKLVEADLMSAADKVASMGGRIEEVRAENKANARAIFRDAQEIANEMKLPIDTVLPFLCKKWPNPPAPQPGAAAAPAGADAADPVDVGA